VSAFDTIAKIASAALPLLAKLVPARFKPTPGPDIKPLPLPHVYVEYFVYQDPAGTKSETGYACLHCPRKDNDRVRYTDPPCPRDGNSIFNITHA
jgi:hypothetical protein